MMDRRALLKRLGLAGLAIPAAMVVERKLVLPEPAKQEVRVGFAQFAQDWTFYAGRLWVTGLEIERGVEHYGALGSNRVYAYPSERRVRISIEGDIESMSDYDEDLGGFKIGQAVRIVPWSK